MKNIFIKFLLLFFALCSVLIWQATNTKALTVYTPDQLVDAGKDLTRIRVAGRVSDKEIIYKTEPKLELNFFIKDPIDGRTEIPVYYAGLKPDMFISGRDVIIDGEYQNGKVTASALLTQCPSKYEPPIPKH